MENSNDSSQTYLNPFAPLLNLYINAKHCIQMPAIIKIQTKIRTNSG